MKTLFIDTSYKFIHVYILNEYNVVCERALSVEKDMSNKILPLIRSCFDDLQFSIKDINNLFVTIGPGSFTGLRVGLTFAKIVAYSLNIKLYPVSTLEYLASISKKERKIISIIDARRGNVYAGYYDNELNLLHKEELISYENINNINSFIVSFDGIYNSNISNIDVVKLIKKHINDVPSDPKLLVPNYLKKTEAEEKLND